MINIHYVYEMDGRWAFVEKESQISFGIGHMRHEIGQ